MPVIQQTAGRRPASVILHQTTQVTTELIPVAAAATVTPWTIHFRILILNMRLHNETQSIVLPVMLVISIEKEITLAERTALLNKIRIVPVADAIGCLTVILIDAG